MGPPPESLGLPDPVGNDQGDPDGGSDDHDHQHLGPDEELQHQQQPEENPGHDRAASLPEQEFVQAENDQRGDHCHPDHQMAIDEADQNER